MRVLRGRSPYRVSFSGGSDLPVYTDKYGGSALSATIAFYVHATLKPRDDRRVIVHSHDLNIVADYNLDEPLWEQGTDLKLIDAVVSRFSPDMGYELEIESDAPVGSGLGASGALAVLITKLMDRYHNRMLTDLEIAELAFDANRDVQGEKVGRQDEASAACGHGITYFSFGDRTVPWALDIPPAFLAELEYRLLLCYLPIQRQKDDPVNSQVFLLQRGDPVAVEAMHRTKAIAEQMRDCLLTCEIDGFAALLTESGLVKKQANPAASSPQIDSFFALAMSQGALGGRLLGGGSGGYALLVCEEGKKRRLAEKLAESGGEVTPLIFDRVGSAVWSV